MKTNFQKKKKKSNFVNELWTRTLILSAACIECVFKIIEDRFYIKDPFYIPVVYFKMQIFHVV